MMVSLMKTSAYVCPGAGLERDKNRAVAWHLVAFAKKIAPVQELSLGVALAMVEHRSEIIELLGMMDRDAHASVNEQETE